MPADVGGVEAGGALWCGVVAAGPVDPHPAANRAIATIAPSFQECTGSPPIVQRLQASTQRGASHTGADPVAGLRPKPSPGPDRSLVLTRPAGSGPAPVTWRCGPVAPAPGRPRRARAPSSDVPDMVTPPFVVDLPESLPQKGLRVFFGPPRPRIEVLGFTVGGSRIVIEGPAAPGLGSEVTIGLPDQTGPPISASRLAVPSIGSTFRVI